MAMINQSTIHQLNAEKCLILGTAQWGWTVPEAEAFLLLDDWLKAGNRRIDCATNYPINRNSAVFRAAERILAAYIQAHGLRDLQVTMKIGSLDNMRSPEVNLAPSFVQMIAEEYRLLLGSNLDCLMFHWDNRQEEDGIRQSVHSLSIMQAEHGIRPGLSGIKHPEVYGKVNQEAGLSFDIQVKHNILHSDLPRYKPYFDPQQHRFYAYGINAGGIKLEGLPYPAESTFLARGGQPEPLAVALQQIASALPGFNQDPQRPAITTMNHLGLIYAGLHPAIHGVLLGVSSKDQMAQSLDFWRSLHYYDFRDVFNVLEDHHFLTLPIK